MDPAAAMFERDRASAALGIELVELGPDVARAALRVTETHLNGHGTVHGGVIFLLADTAFGCACNGGEEEHTIASASIEFLRPAALGEQLVAEARRRTGHGRSGIYDVTVTGEDGTVAEFRGRSHRRRSEGAGPGPAVRG
jgi:acyl-CoA thioesterase